MFTNIALKLTIIEAFCLFSSVREVAYGPKHSLSMQMKLPPNIHLFEVTP
jgi:hypothetical protein